MVASNPNVTIDCKPDGPYLVKGLADLRSSDGRSLAVQPVVALCRCGGSANKPFCDGTHQRNGFSGARASAAAAGAQRASYRASGITIHDDRALCAHAGRCTDGLAAVFKYGSEPWIDAAGADVAAIVETIRRCPSGALSYTLDRPEPPAPAEAPCVVVTKNGPYAVSGGIGLADAATGQTATTARYTLCRCGASKNKPFCDGSHWAAGFADDRN
jgi:CDGSH-type Zn-finger protein